MGKYLEQALAIRAAMDKVGSLLTDEQAITSVELFRPWNANDTVTSNDIRRHGELLYRCIQGHTTQDDWMPDATPALWARISVEEWPAWKQPLGAHDAYKKGDKVTYAGKRWISAVDGNVWIPGVALWTETT